MHNKKDIMAPCGLLCSECDIFRAQHEPDVAERIVRWFKEARNKDVRPEQIVCDGCLGDPQKVWSADCGIRRCLIGREITSCHDCSDFACERIEKWAASGKRYGEALMRLQTLRAGKT